MSEHETVKQEHRDSAKEIGSEWMVYGDLAAAQLLADRDAERERAARLKALEEAADLCDGAQADRWVGGYHGFNPAQVTKWNDWAVRLGDSIRALATPAERKR